MTKKELKQIYKTKKKSLKAEIRKEKEEYLLKLKELDSYNLDNKNNPPKRSVLEEIGNAVTHGLGAIFAIVSFILMWNESVTLFEKIAAIVYSFGLFALFSMSCLYHSFKYGSRVKRLFRRFDYSGIYFLIGATFAPILLCYVGGSFGQIFFLVQWIVILVGVTFIAVFGPTKLKAMHMALYLIIGWSGLLFVPRMIEDNLGLFYCILGGGVVYTLGIIPFALKKKCSHFIWHFFVLIGAIVQWLGNYLYIFVTH